MQAARYEPLEKTAALLERAYRLALVLQSRTSRGDGEVRDVPAGAFEEYVIAGELVAVLDEARVGLVEQSGRTAESDK